LFRNTRECRVRRGLTGRRAANEYFDSVVRGRRCRNREAAFGVGIVIKVRARNAVGSRRPSAKNVVVSGKKAIEEGCKRDSADDAKT
jgi:hypothetical protein